MRVGGRFSLTALVILASELFSLVLSAVRSPKHCLHTIKATKRDLPCPVNAIMNQAASVRHKICGCSFVDWSASHATYGSRTQWLHKALILLWARVRANMWVDLAGITSTCMDFRFSKWPSARKLGYFWTETLRCGRDRRDLWGRSMFWCSFSASQWIVCYARYWWIDRNT